ncbi:MAG: sodium:solute symporter family transporter [Endozoicomonas sp.]|uniref:sodium:solute symporter family transporter n=1 Tax=Endozoicomonas sp. TaxID=1892382 RepID=UPI003D9AC2CF
MAEFGVLNWSIMGGYVAINLVLGYILGRSTNSAQSFYLGNRDIPWWAIGLSVLATYVSALSFLGGPAWSYSEGFSVIALHLNYPLVIAVVLIFFLPFFYNSGAASIYDYMEKRFGKASRSLMSIVFLLSQTLTAGAILYSTALILAYITGVSVHYIIVLVAIVALIYTAMGGIAAVIWTDVVQAIVLLVGAGIICYYLIAGMSLPLVEVLSELKAQGKTNPLDFSLVFNRENTVIAGLIGMTIFHITVYGANQMMVQRTLAAKSIGDAKKAYLLMGFSAIFLYALFFFLGILFYSYYEGRVFENSNTIILEFAASIGVPGLMGILAAAVLAASLSSLDSSFNSLATITTTDFYQKYIKPQADELHYLKATRWFTLMWASLVIMPAMVYTVSEGSILAVLSKVGSYFVGAKLSMFGLGFFSRRTAEKGLLVGVAVGFVAILLVDQFTDISWAWYGLIGAAVNVVIAIPASMLLDGPQTLSRWSVAGQKAYFAAENLPEKENGWYRIPGRVDAISYWLIAFMFAAMGLLFVVNWLIP